MLDSLLQRMFGRPFDVPCLRHSCKLRYCCGTTETLTFRPLPSSHTSLRSAAGGAGDDGSVDIKMLAEQNVQLKEALKRLHSHSIAEKTDVSVANDCRPPALWDLGACLKCFFLIGHENVASR